MTSIFKSAAEFVVRFRTWIVNLVLTLAVAWLLTRVDPGQLYRHHMIYRVSCACE